MLCTYVPNGTNPLLSHQPHHTHHKVSTFEFDQRDFNFTLVWLLHNHSVAWYADSAENSLVNEPDFCQHFFCAKIHITPLDHILTYLLDVFDICLHSSNGEPFALWRMQMNGSTNKGPRNTMDRYWSTPFKSYMLCICLSETFLHFWDITLQESP